MPVTKASAQRANVDLGLAARGVLSENFCWETVNNTATAPTSQRVFGELLGLRGGTVVTGVVLRNLVAAVGTLPTTARFGIASSAGVMLAVSGNLNALAQWAAGPNRYAFTAAYTVPSDGGYFACFVVDGTWSVTNPTPVRGNSSNAAGGTIPGATAANFEWASQTDLPAVSSSLTTTTPSSVPYYMAFY